MRFVTFNDYTPGLLQDGRVIDLIPALGEIASLPWDQRIPAMIASFERVRRDIERLAGDEDGIPMERVRLCSPNPRPRKLLCELGDFNAELPEPKGNTDFFLKSPDSIVGPDGEIVLPDIATDIYQARGALAVVIGRPCRNVSAADAEASIFGYTGFIDVSAPKYGRANIGTFFGSSFDSFGPMGPCIVTADEIGDPGKLEVQIRLNDRVYQSYALSDLHYAIPEQVATASAIMSLRPGDTIIAGKFEHEAPALHPWDEIMLTVSGIGQLHEQVRERA